ncbi:hypothetical protein MANES_11G055401v8 [Manihot esculenta]|uniref:Uncharacterized protein n=1 Tax=Manihot esculenta TaxID=3983 RepID=A0ACB7GV60_MANES|nr:hypothetical protein MANES_11G055401v8 [Manihot esculenta]
MTRPSCGSIFRNRRETKCSPTINGSKQLDVPCLIVIRVHNWRWRDDYIFQLSQLNKQIFTSLLSPSLLKIKQDIPSNRSFKFGMDIMPRFSWTNLFN